MSLKVSTIRVGVRSVLMMFGKQNKKSPRAGGAPRIKLHSISAMLKERRFDGSFDVAGSAHKFTYVPAKAELVGGKLQLLGRLTMQDGRGRARAKDGVRALMVGTQGGIGAAPVRQQVLVGGVQTSTAATSGQQQQMAGENPPGGKPAQSPPPKAAQLPEIDSTGALSFCGVIYFRLEPLDGRALGVEADLSHLQLNARLAPTDDVGRRLHGLYSSVVDALSAETQKETPALIDELNKILAKQ